MTQRRNLKPYILPDRHPTAMLHRNVTRLQGSAGTTFIMCGTCIEKADSLPCMAGKHYNAVTVAHIRGHLPG